jgi:purine-nucleoside phosphorylase
MNAASRIPMRLLEGTYVSLPGPNMETPAEYTWLHRIGGDLVGMSTVPEVIAARHMGMKVAGLSVVSNVLLSARTYPGYHS